MRIGIASFVLILVLAAFPARAADTVITNILCLHRDVVENYIDIIEAEGGMKSSSKMLIADIKKGECIKFSETKFPVLERGVSRPPIQIGKDTAIQLTPVRVLNYWGIDAVVLNQV